MARGCIATLNELIYLSCYIDKFGEQASIRQTYEDFDKKNGVLIPCTREISMKEKIARVIFDYNKLVNGKVDADKLKVDTIHDLNKFIDDAQTQVGNNICKLVSEITNRADMDIEDILLTGTNGELIFNPELDLHNQGLRKLPHNKELRDLRSRSGNVNGEEYFYNFINRIRAKSSSEPERIAYL